MSTHPSPLLSVDRSNVAFFTPNTRPTPGLDHVLKDAGIRVHGHHHWRRRHLLALPPHRTYAVSLCFSPRRSRLGHRPRPLLTVSQAA